MGIHLTFKIHGGLVAKIFSTTAKVAGSNVSKLHSSKLQFFLRQRGQMEDFDYTGEKFENSQERLRTADCGVCYGVDYAWRTRQRTRDS